MQVPSLLATADILPFRRELIVPRDRIVALFGLTTEDFDKCRFPSAVTCKIITAAVFLHQLAQPASVVSEFLSIPPDQVAKIADTFQSFFIIYSVPKNIGTEDLAGKLLKFFAGKERRIDFNAFSRNARRASLVTIEQREDTAQSIESIVRKVSNFLDVDIRDINSDRRRIDMIWGRKLAMYAARHLTTASLPLIGRMIGKRDHTTVLHACRTLEGKLGSRPPPDISLDALLDHIATRIPDVQALRQAALSRLSLRENAYFKDAA